MTVTVRPATVNVPLREPPGFADAVNVVLPSPEPFAPEVMDNHDVLLAAVHSHPVCVSILICAPVPPAEEMEVVIGLTLYEQVLDAAA